MILSQCDVAAHTEESEIECNINDINFRPKIVFNSWTKVIPFLIIFHGRDKVT